MGLNLRPLREAAGLSLTAAALDLGVSHVAYRKWELGQGYPRADKLPAIAALFGCGIDDLFRKQDSPPESIIHQEVRRYYGA